MARLLTICYKNGVSVQRTVNDGEPDNVHAKFIRGDYSALVGTPTGPLWLINLREVVDVYDDAVV